jgi:hypothetical protein
MGKQKHFPHAAPREESQMFPSPRGIGKLFAAEKEVEEKSAF